MSIASAFGSGPGEMNLGKRVFSDVANMSMEGVSFNWSTTYWTTVCFNDHSPGRVVPPREKASALTFLTPGRDTGTSAITHGSQNSSSF